MSPFNIYQPNLDFQRPNERKTIFLVDDDVANLAFGNDLLSKTYNVVTINSGVRLLKMLEKHIPDLILLDIEMAVMSGLDVLKILKSQEKTQHIPVILQTGTVNEEKEVRGLSLGAVDYVTKPHSPHRLLKRIETQLLIDSQRRELLEFNANLQGMVIQKTEELVALQEAIMTTFADLIEYRDDITAGHVGRMQGYLYVFFVALLEHEFYKGEGSQWNISLILQSAHLHDVGKIGIKDDILLKPGKLTAEEFEAIKKHVLFGEAVIDRIMIKTTKNEFLEHARTMIATHHEKWDGSGYPRGLSANEIPLQGRLLAIIDVYDALTSDRPYKKAYSHEKALQIISDGSGSHFDPDLVNVFLSISDTIKSVAG